MRPAVHDEVQTPDFQCYRRYRTSALVGRVLLREAIRSRYKPNVRADRRGQHWILSEITLTRAIQSKYALHLCVECQTRSGKVIDGVVT